MLRSAVRGGQIRMRRAEGRLRKAAAGGVLIDVPAAAAQALADEINQSYSSEYWRRNVNDHTRERLKALLEDGIAQHMSGEAIAQSIFSDEGGIFSLLRARRIARTETTGAMNGGHHSVSMQLIADPETGVVGREWIAVMDNDTRPSHRVADGKQVLGGNPFVVGGYPCRFPGDPSLPVQERAHCRCTILDVYAGEEDPERISSGTVGLAPF